jgi:hypothetical protein
MDTLSGVQQIQAVQTRQRGKLVVRDVYKVVIFSIESDSLVEIHTFSFEKSAIKFRQSPFFGELFSVLTEGSKIYEISLETGTLALVGSLSIER